MAMNPKDKAEIDRIVAELKGSSPAVLVPYAKAALANIDKNKQLSDTEKKLEQDRLIVYLLRAAEKLYGRKIDFRLELAQLRLSNFRVELSTLKMRMEIKKAFEKFEREVEKVEKKERKIQLETEEIKRKNEADQQAALAKRAPETAKPLPKPKDAKHPKNAKKPKQGSPKDQQESEAASLGDDIVACILDFTDLMQEAMKLQGMSLMTQDALGEIKSVVSKLDPNEAGEQFSKNLGGIFDKMDSMMHKAKEALGPDHAHISKLEGSYDRFTDALIKSLQKGPPPTADLKQAAELGAQKGIAAIKTPIAALPTKVEESHDAMRDRLAREADRVRGMAMKAPEAAIDASSKISETVVSAARTSLASPPKLADIAKPAPAPAQPTASTSQTPGSPKAPKKPWEIGKPTPKGTQV
jgi:hypothetical protein